MLGLLLPYGYSLHPRSVVVTGNNHVHIFLYTYMAKSSDSLSATQLFFDLPTRNQRIIIRICFVGCSYHIPAASSLLHIGSRPLHLGLRSEMQYRNAVPWLPVAFQAHQSWCLSLQHPPRPMMRGSQEVGLYFCSFLYLQRSPCPHQRHDR